VDELSDTGTYDVDDDDSVAVVEARRQIDRAFGVLSNVSSVTSVSSKIPVDNRVSLDCLYKTVALMLQCCVRLFVCLSVTYVLWLNGAS